MRELFHEDFLLSAGAVFRMQVNHEVFIVHDNCIVVCTIGVFQWATQPHRMKECPEIPLSANAFVISQWCEGFAFGSSVFTFQILLQDRPARIEEPSQLRCFCWLRVGCYEDFLFVVVFAE